MTLERIAEEALKDVEGLAVFENLQPKVGNLLLAIAEDGDRCSYQGVRDSVHNVLRKAVTHEELKDYVVTFLDQLQVDVSLVQPDDIGKAQRRHQAPPGGASGWAAFLPTLNANCPAILEHQYCTVKRRRHRTPTSVTPTKPRRSA